MKKVSNLLNTKTKKIVAIVLVIAIISAITIPCVIHFGGSDKPANMTQEMKEEFYVEEFKKTVNEKDTLLVGTAIVDEETGETKMLAITPEGTKYSVYVDKDGKMTSSRYSIAVSKSVNKHIDGELRDFLGDYDIKGSLVIQDTQKCKLSEKSEFEDVQKTSGYNYICQLFVNEKKQKEVSEEDIKWVFEKSGLNAYVEVFFVPRVEGIPLSENPVTNATYTFYTERVDNGEK